jgi:hypothetical protein
MSFTSRNAERRIVVIRSAREWHPFLNRRSRIDEALNLACVAGFDRRNEHGLSHLRSVGAIARFDQRYNLVCTIGLRKL